MAITRISITIPARLLTQLDRRARDLGRSRSWAVAEAVRQFVDTTAPSPLPYNAAPVDAAADVAAARSHHIATDLRLSPAERLRRADELAQFGRKFRRQAQRRQVIGFDSYDDYYEWKKARLAKG